MSAALPKWKSERLKRISKMLRHEASCYSDGFATRKGDGTLDWPPESKIMHARFIQLTAAAGFLDHLATKAKEAKP